MIVCSIGWDDDLILWRRRRLRVPFVMSYVAQRPMLVWRRQWGGRQKSVLLSERPALWPLPLARFRRMKARGAAGRRPVLNTTARGPCI